MSPERDDRLMARSMSDLFLARLQDLIFSERMLLRVLPSLARACSASLEGLFFSFETATSGQIVRLEQVFESVGRRPRSRHSGATVHLLRAIEEAAAVVGPGVVRDAAVLAAIQTAGYHHMAAYSTLTGWAAQLGEEQAVTLLNKSLREEISIQSALSVLARTPRISKAA